MHLLKIELLKIKSYRTFYVLMGAFFVLMTLTMTYMPRFISGMFSEVPVDTNQIPLFQFPDVWLYMSWLGGLFALIPALVMVILTCNEFEFKTSRQSVINGLDRADLMVSKILLALTISVVSTVYLSIVVIILGVVNTDNITGEIFFDKIEFVAAYFTQIFAYLIFATFVAMLMKRTGLSIVFLLMYYFIIENIIGLFVPPDVEAYFFIESLEHILPLPFNLMGEEIKTSAKHFGVAWGYIAAFIGGMYFMLQRRDL